MNSAFPYSSYMMSGGCKGSIRPWGNLLHPSPGDDQGHSEAYDLPHLSETPHFSKSTLSGRYIPLGATPFVDYTWVALFTSALSAVFILNSCSMWTSSPGPRFIDLSARSAFLAVTTSSIERLRASGGEFRKEESECRKYPFTSLRD